MVSFDLEIKTVTDELILRLPFAKPGKMFGFPAYYAGKKLCACLYEGGVAVKLPETRVRQLLGTDPHVIEFIPYGKNKMREWIQINPSVPTDLKAYQNVFEESVEFVLSSQEIHLQGEEKAS